MVDRRRSWNLVVVVGVVVASVIGCGGDDASDDGSPVSTSAANADSAEPSGAGDATESAPEDLGPIEVRLEGTRESDGNAFDDTVTFRLQGPCDGTGECSLARPDGAAGYGVPGWEVDLELDAGTYAYEGSEAVTIDRCGDQALTDELQTTISVSVVPVTGDQPEVQVIERWAAVPPADMSDGTLCSGLPETVFTLG